MNVMAIKTILCAIIVILYGTTTQSQKVWGALGNYPGTTRMQAVSFTIGDKGYFGLGRDDTGYKKDFWEYDINSNTWTQLTDFSGEERFSAVGFEINGKGYTGIGGNSSKEMNDFWEYDPVIDTWTQKANFGGVARKYAVGFSINDKGYIGLGDEGNDFWEYDPSTDKWTQKADFMGVKRWGAIGFSIGSKGYVGTGMFVAEGNKKDFWEYDPNSNMWTQLADLGGIERAWAVGFSIGGYGYIGVGYNGGVGSGKLSDFWEYDTLSNQWTEIAGFGGGPIDDPTFFSNDTLAIVGTGTDSKGVYQNDFFVYPSISNSITEKDDNGFRMSIFPNPSNKSIILNFVPKRNEEIYFEIYNHLGAINLKGLIDQGESINIESLSSGVYMLRAQYMKKNFSSKFIKE